MTDDLHTVGNAPYCTEPAIAAIAGDISGIGGVVRLFEVMNWATRIAHIVANSPEEAVKIGIETKHMRRGRPPRRLRDVTEPCLESDPTGTLAAILAGDKNGTVIEGESGWVFAT